jgi:hypothetical protein
MEKQMGKVGRVRAFLRICNTSVRFWRKKRAFFYEKEKEIAKKCVDIMILMWYN